jgi:Family of unknown function (DUF5678)
MAGTQGKTLFLRNLPAELVREAKAAAARRGQTLTTLVADALSRSLLVEGASEERADDLERDIAWYQKNRSTLLRRYPGEYIAIVDENVVDRGHDFDALATRVFTRFGDRNVYMPRVQDRERVVRIRSPRKSRP